MLLFVYTALIKYCFLQAAVTLGWNFSINSVGCINIGRFSSSTTGVTDYMTTEISTSKQKKFSLVTFVDTPGLVDGDMKYPFDVNEAIAWLGEYTPADYQPTN